MKSVSLFVSPLESRNLKAVKVILYPESGEQSLIEISEAEAAEFGEANVQLQESCNYEYSIDKGYQLVEIPGVVRRFKNSNSSGGRIAPGIYTGTLSVEVVETATGNICGYIDLEVRSVKSSYRDDYRTMLEDIAERCTDLLMQYTSPVTQYLSQNYSSNSNTLYQQFAFIKSVIDTSEFLEAVHRILNAPVTRWADREGKTNITKGVRINNSIMRQIASGSNRIPLPENHYMHSVLDTVPAKVVVREKHDSPDTVENQFIKHVLSVYRIFCSDVKNKMDSISRECREARQLEERLDNILDHQIFKQISQPATLSLNSPVLQRKEGYREILKSWLMFDLASKLMWHGGDDVYKAGKRDVATLYEYWSFFKLLELFGTIFNFAPVEVESLIESTSDGLGLKLKSGKFFALRGIYDRGSRKLAIKFSYNRTFSGNKEYPSAGSWSKNMRPDYTLTIWPYEFSEAEAESQELILHIHFDAKYKVTGITDLFGVDTSSAEEDLDVEKLDQNKGVYKRADLLKMHAYKDAVRRTVGAYVLYPGTDDYIAKGFHELIPGLGAFPVRPSKANDGTEALKNFVKDVVEHFVNRSSQQERLTYHVYDIYKNRPDFEIREPLPESNEGGRVRPPSETSVLIGYCENSGRYEWIKERGLYNFRMDSDRGSLRLTPEVAGAEYVLIHLRDELKTGYLWRIKDRGPRVFSKLEMAAMGYENPSHEYYLVYTITKTGNKEFDGLVWDIRKLEGYKPGYASSLPFAVTMTELMKVRVN
ncbi:MAG: DUF2357 domain-containing protein [Chloroflexi bacterium]|nr:DUF2357 domain-containing protein [Chloroflexota bacterium]